MFSYVGGYHTCIIRVPIFPLHSDDEDIYQEENLEFDSGFGNIIVVDNLPVVPREKFEKLEGVIRKIYSQIGVIKEDGLWMPVDPDSEKSLGYCFVQYNTPQVLSVPPFYFTLYAHVRGHYNRCRKRENMFCY